MKTLEINTTYKAMLIFCKSKLERRQVRNYLSKRYYHLRFSNVMHNIEYFRINNLKFKFLIYINEKKCTTHGILINTIELI